MTMCAICDDTQAGEKIEYNGKQYHFYCIMALFIYASEREADNEDG